MPASSDPTPPDRDDPPPFDPVFEEASAEERVYAVVLQTREPTPVSELAERADCDRSTARKYLDWFTELSIVTKYDDQQPVTYERNPAYFEWRRINELAEQYTTDELGDRVRKIRDRIQHYQRSYDAPTPGSVDALSVSDDETIDSVWADLTDWATKREELRRHDRARQLQMDTEFGAAHS